MINDTVGAAASLLARLLLAALFVIEGWSKIKGYDGAVAYMQRFGVPGALLPLAILVELGGGLMVAVGWQTRLAALALAGFALLAAVLFHTNFADRNQELHFFKDLAIAGGFLALVAHGAGAWSLDALMPGGSVSSFWRRPSPPS